MSTLENILKKELQQQTLEELYHNKGRNFFVELLRTEHPKLYKQLITSSQQISQQGFTIIDYVNLAQLPVKVSEAISLTISCFFGSPTQTQPNNPCLVWPIRATESEHKRKTFSQTTDEAFFHTDTQYFDNPEPLFGLFCIEADKLGQGTNLLCDIQLVKSQLPNYIIEALQQPYPFQVPSVFTKTCSDADIEIIWKPILEGCMVRYRKDTIQTALNHLPKNSISRQQCEALNIFEQHLVPHSKVHLIPGQIIFVDNHRMLHARSSFENPNRLLYRIRVK